MRKSCDASKKLLTTQNVIPANAGISQYKKIIFLLNFKEKTMKTIIKTKIFLSLMLFGNLAIAQTCKDYITDEWQNSRYTDNGNQTITDNTTKLTWKKCSEGQSGNDCSTGSATTMNWQNALALGGSSFAGKSDWRLPNIEELRSIAALNCYSPSINETMFPNTSASSFWSASPNSDGSDNAWILDFPYGYDNGSNRSNSNRVRLVRSGE
jgi:hypothetical protein